MVDSFIAEQLTLGIKLRDDATFANFYPGNNAMLHKTLMDFCESNNELFVYLWGEPGSGRSHLLQACCHVYFSKGKTAVYLPLRDNVTLQPNVLENLEQLDFIALDDVDVVLNSPEWEEALFHFYNRARDAQTKIIVSANASPVNLLAKLADLKSRLAWGLTLHLETLSEEQAALALKMRARLRGIDLNQDVIKYLLTRYPRNMTTLCNLLEKLDQASMASKRRITIPFVRETLQ